MEGGRERENENSSSSLVSQTLPSTQTSFGPRSQDAAGSGSWGLEKHPGGARLTILVWAVE